MCGQSYTSRSCYNSHMDKHSNNKRYSCSHCGKKFFVWISRRTHIYKVHLKRTYCDCPYCGKGFYTQHHMKKHIDADHFDIAPYQCVVCGKTFKQSSNLRCHEKIHEGPKSCDICRKELKTMACLRQHMRTHSDERNYICPVCSKAITYNMIPFFNLYYELMGIEPPEYSDFPSKICSSCETG
uniref:C2H2-type domain-containing protein n=1 Tax=Lutzomyia longipalpis TaxID=7200 RepID=A0A1B0CB42_LUTLO